MRFIVDVESDALTGHAGRDELAAILLDLSRHVAEMGDEDRGNLRDSNGNKIGFWRFVLNSE